MKTYAIMDGRARSMDTDDATVLEFCDTPEEAQEQLDEWDDDAVIVEYDDNEGVLTNPVVRHDLEARKRNG